MAFTRRKIQTRRGTAAQWTSANPILKAGELGVETDTRKMKVGDGTTAWTSLLYVVGGAGSSTWGSITGTLSSQTDLQTALNAKQSTSTLSEAIDDRVANLLVAGTNVVLTYDDTANTLTIDASGGGGSGNTYFPSGW